MGQRSADSNGEQSALDYDSYLKLDELTSLQHPRTRPSVPDETLFITVHQVHELWFKQTLHELERLCVRLDEDDTWAARAILDRLSTIVRSLLTSLSVLETMRITEFNRFRAGLGTASGMQSEQFKRIQRICRGPEASRASSSSHSGAMRAAQEPDLRDSAARYFRRLAAAAADAPLADVLTVAYEDGAACIVEVAEAMARWDEQWAAWRFRHVQLVRRMIGRSAGSGGTSGLDYLQAKVDGHFFPELWEFRTRLGAAPTSSA